MTIKYAQVVGLTHKDLDDLLDGVIKEVLLGDGTPAWVIAGETREAVAKNAERFFKAREPHASVFVKRSDQPEN